jgi:hypothetical protein
MAFRILGLLVGLFCAMMAPNAPAQSVQEFEALARQCAPSVHPATLAAVVKTESSFRPYAININGSRQLPRQPANQAEAIATAEYLLANGYNFDSGLGQINSTNVRKFGMAWTEVFEPCANLTAAARVLTECFVRASDGEPNDQAALRNALSCYNTGNFTRGMPMAISAASNALPARFLRPWSRRFFPMANPTNRRWPRSQKPPRRPRGPSLTLALTPLAGGAATPSAGLPLGRGWNENCKANRPPSLRLALHQQERIDPSLSQDRILQIDASLCK